MQGIYQHYKGDYYFLEKVVMHTETEEPMAIYRSLKNGAEWARPWDMFSGLVEVGGKEVQRFKLINGINTTHLRGIAIR